MNLQPIARIVLILSLVFINIGCDQVTKSLVRSNVDSFDRVELFEHNVILTKVENRGAAYSLGANLSPIAKKVFLQFIPAIALILLLGMLFVKNELSILKLTGFSFVIGGGIGNIFDRITYGSVTDFLYIDFEYFSTEIFNMADVSIIFGTVLIILQSLFYRNR